MVPEKLQVLAKFGLRSICSQNLGGCLLAHAPKNFAIARMLGFPLFKICSNVRKLFFVGFLVQKQIPFYMVEMVLNSFESGFQVQLKAHENKMNHKS